MAQRKARETAMRSTAGLVGIGIALGAAIGAAAGNPAIGVALGIVFGAAIGAARSRRELPPGA
jgi:hypothetical protein